MHKPLKGPFLKKQTLRLVGVLAGFMTSLTYPRAALSDPPDSMHIESLWGVSPGGLIVLGSQEAPDSLIEVTVHDGRAVRATYRRRGPPSDMDFGPSEDGQDESDHLAGTLTRWTATGDPAILSRIPPTELGTASLQKLRPRFVRSLGLTRVHPSLLRVVRSRVKDSMWCSTIGSRSHGPLFYFPSGMYSRCPTRVHLFEHAPTKILFARSDKNNKTDYVKGRLFTWLGPDERRARRMTQRGFRLLERRRARQATPIFSAAIALDSHLLRARLGLARALAEAGVLWPEARAQLQIPYTGCPLQRSADDEQQQEEYFDVVNNSSESSDTAKGSAWFSAWQDEAGSALSEWFEEEKSRYEDRGCRASWSARSADPLLALQSKPRPPAPGGSCAFIFSRIFFWPGKSIVAKSQESGLELNAKALLSPRCRRSTWQIELVGYAGKSEEDRIKLAAARVQSVKVYLMAKGMDEGRLRVRLSRRPPPVDPDFRISGPNTDYGLVDFVIDRKHIK